MKHTNSQRGPDGLFARSDGPKAKRIEVWLQPNTVTLLDALCRQWAVGRGKAIDRLLSLGQFPQSAMEADTQPTPTPSAPQPPEPRFAIGDVVIRTAGPRQGESFTVAGLMWATVPEPEWRYGTGDGTGVAESVLELAPAARDRLLLEVD